MSVKAWIEAMRLRTLPVSVAGVVGGTAVAIADGAFRPVAAGLCLLFALLCQIASNFANEYYDFKAGRDKVGRDGPRRGVTEGDITPAGMKRAIYGTLAAAAAVGLCLTTFGGVWLIPIGALIGLGALAYSTGPYPLSTHCLGEVAVIVFFGIVPVNLTYYVQALTWSQPVLLSSLAIGLMGANVLIVNNTRDIPDDRLVGKHTLATSFGSKAMGVLYLANGIAAAALTWNVWRNAGQAWCIVPAAYLLIAALVSIRLATTHGKSLNPLLGVTSMLMFIFSVFMLIVS